MIIYCCGCKAFVEPRLTDGEEVYSHRPDLSDLPFWKCDACKNYVGCHHKTKNRTAPLGNIPDAEMRKARGHIHALLDPIWKSGKIKRRALYSLVSTKVGWEYHTAKLRTIEEAREAYRAIREIKRDIDPC